MQDRFGKSLLELGGNNGSLTHSTHLFCVPKPHDISSFKHSAAIVMPDADLDLALSAVLFGAVGTAGQRCTSTRRLYLHRSIFAPFLQRLSDAYTRVPIGDPLEARTLVGPLHTAAAVEVYKDSIELIKRTGGEIMMGGEVHQHASGSHLAGGNFVLPTIAIPTPSATSQNAELDKIWTEETFAPVLKVAAFDELEEAIELNNAVPQGLSSSLWSSDVRSLGKWIGPEGSDCGIVNVSSTVSLCALPISSNALMP